MNLKYFVCAGMVLMLCTITQAQESVDLSGIWEFQIDRNENVKTDGKFDDTILLPGSMPQRLKGDKPSTKTVWTGSLYDSSYFHNPYMKKYQTEDNFKLPFFLTPDRQFMGVAWYRKKVIIPQNMAGKRIVLYLERPHIITTLFVNGKEVGTRNSLCVAHEYDITKYVKAGKQATIAIRIDNDYKKVGVGQDSHSVTDQTQGNWNGVVGQMKIRCTPHVYADQVMVYPDIKTNTVRVETSIIRTKDNPTRDITISYRVHDDNSTYEEIEQHYTLTGDTTKVSYVCKMFDNTKLWDEFEPNLYKMEVSVYVGKDRQVHHTTETFGMRSIETQGKDILVNGRLTMMRGTVENCDFPNTGYAPMTKDEWLRVFRKCKEYGLNHMRFHSFCPPEAAFEAADEVGFYLQPEGPSWPNHGVRLGNGQIIDQYLMEETKLMVKKYGNHPSFTMLSCGNEPSGGWVKWVSNFVDYWKKADPRRIYTGASVGGSWAWQPKNQYHVKAGARGLDNWIKQQPESQSNYLSKIDTVSQPFISHETGQWCVFPDFDEIDQYTGAVNKAKNFEIFRDILKDKGMEQMAHKFLMSSGKTQVMCYKAEIERTLRTPHYAGYQLLGLNDYSGQGSALVGPLNVFWREKGYVTACEWREFSSPVTILAELPRFVYWDDEDLPISIKISNFSQQPLSKAWLELSADFGDGSPKFFKAREVSVGMGLHEVMNSIFSLEMGISSAKKVVLHATLKEENGTVITQNHWDLYIFPKSVLESIESENTQNVVICNTLDKNAIEALQQGKNVLIIADGKVKYGAGISQQFTPVFWNTSWFKMRPPHTTGMYVNPYHPVFKDFPTDDWANVQWWALMNRQQVMLMDDFPKDFMPIVQPIDTWFLSRKLGMLFEANVLNGKIMMTTMPLNQKDYTAYPAIAQMRQSILNYMQSDAFRPSQTIDMKLIQDIFNKPTPDVNMFTNDNPDELKKGVR